MRSLCEHGSGKPNNPGYLAAALRLTCPGAVIVFDDIVANADLDATALQTVGVKGWDGFILARRRRG